jgi:hypothetical protein
MKIKFLLLLALLLPAAALAQTTITTGYSSGTTTVYSTSTITTSGTVVISGSANISFIADTKVTLAAGFKVAVGATFRAKAGADVDGDGMPNSWENTHTLNLQSNDAASDADSDGIANGTEYQLGTNPRTTVANTTDSSNTTALKVHKPN